MPGPLKLSTAISEQRGWLCTHRAVVTSLHGAPTERGPQWLNYVCWSTSGPTRLPEGTGTDFSWASCMCFLSAPSDPPRYRCSPEGLKKTRSNQPMDEVPVHMRHLAGRRQSGKRRGVVGQVQLVIGLVCPFPLPSMESPQATNSVKCLLTLTHVAG